MTTLTKSKPGPVVAEPGPTVQIKPDYPTPAFPNPVFTSSVPLPKEESDALSQYLKSIYSTLSGARQASTAAEGNPKRVTLGRDRIGGDLITAFEYDDKLVMMWAWGVGPYQQVEDIYFGTKRWTGTVRHYLGANTEDIDPVLEAGISGYTANPEDLCFSVVEIEADSIIDTLEAVAVIKGRKNVRRSTENGGTNAYSDNPSELTAYLVKAFYNVTIPQEDLDACADHNDELLAELTGNSAQDRGKKRAQIGITFDKFTDKKTIIKNMAEYAGVFLAWDGDTLRMFPNKDGDPVATIEANQIIEGSAAKWSNSNSQRPNVIKLVYTDATKDRDGWEDATFTTPYPSSGPVRESLIRMPAIQSKAFATRKATERLNFFNTTELRGRFRTRDEGIMNLVGELVTFNDVEGTTNKVVRLLDVKVKGKGEWSMDWIEHDSAAYSNTYIATPTAPDSELPDPTVIPNGPTPSEIREVLFTDQTRTTYTRFEIRFNGVVWPFAISYRVQMSAGSVVVLDTDVAHKGSGVEHLVATPPTSQGVLYTVKIWIINVFGNASATPGTLTKTGDGKTIPPTDPSGLYGREANQMVALEWVGSVDTDLRGYQIRRLAQADYEGAATPADRWDHANAVTVISRIDSTKAVSAGEPVGGQVYMVKAEDFAGNYSEGFSAKLIQVTADQSGFSIGQTLDLDDTNSTNFYQYNTLVNVGVTGGDYVTAGGNAAWEDYFIGGATAEWEDECDSDDEWTYLNGDGIILSDWWDSGKDNNGTWSFSAAEIVGIEGVAFVFGELVESADYPPSPYGNFDTNGSAIARYARVYVSRGYPGGPELPSIVGYTATIKLPFDITFNGNRVFEPGQSSVPGSGQPLEVVFTKSFGLPPKVKAQLLGSTPGFANPDNVTATGFDLYVWDIDGDEMAGTVDWTADGA